MDIYTVAFFGHRYIDNPFRIEDRLEEEIRRLLSEHEYVDFLVGRDGEFDQFASSAVLRVRKQYRDDNSSLVLVLPYARAEYLNNEESYHDYYSDVEISYAASKAHPKAAIQIRNREMVDRADLILCCIEREQGGAWQTIQYAIIYTILDGLKNRPMEYDDQMVRQILECVTVDSKEQITVIFIGGLKIKQSLLDC